MTDDAPSSISVENNHNHEQLIPDEILAHLKDHRYIHNLISICGELNIKPITATLLYYLLVFMKSRKTLGMEHVGIEYRHVVSSGSSSASRLRLIAKTVLQIIVPLYLLGYQHYGNGHDEENNSNGNDNSSGGLGRESNTSTNSNERLRGAARRSAFYEQRRRMLERAAAATSDSSVSPDTVSRSHGAVDVRSNIVAANGSNNMFIQRERSTFEALCNGLRIGAAFIQRASASIVP